MNGSFSLFPHGPDELILTGLIALFVTFLLVVMWIAWRGRKK